MHDISNTGATAFVEPLVTIDLGNELRELVIEEQHEIETYFELIKRGGRIRQHDDYRPGFETGG